MGKYSKLKNLVPTYKEALEDLKRMYVNAEQNELMEMLSQVKEEKKRLEKELKEVNQRITAIEEVLIELMESQDITQIKNSSLGTFSIKTQVFVSPRDKEAMYRWLRANGHGSIIKESVHNKALNSLFSEILQEESIPEEAGVNVFLKSSISIKKKEEL